MPEFMGHKNCRRFVCNLTYLPGGFSECNNDTNGDDSNGNHNDNGNNE